MAVKYLIFSFLFIFILFFNQAYGETIKGKPKVIDGDTLHIGNNKIRLHAIDAPEKKQKCTKNNIEWDCGLQSTKFLKKLIGNDQIRCVANSKDKYKRYIGVCYKNNIDLNAQMVINGWAIAYQYYSLDYIKEEEQAKINKIGIWSGEFLEPYLFRKKNR